jgi:hypothetical protein
MKVRTLFHALPVSLCGFCLPLYAHHSVMVFETSTPVVLKGRIAEVKFANPHSAIFIDIVEPNGEQVRWAVENSGTLAMTRQRGFDDATLQVGDPIEVCGYAPKSASRAAGAPAASAAPAANAAPQPAASWWEGAGKVITGRLLMLKSGPAEHWSHYGPLDACTALLASD